MREQKKYKKGKTIDLMIGLFDNMDSPYLENNNGKSINGLQLNYSED